MFSKNDFNLLHDLRSDYLVLASNGHDIKLRSKFTEHEWIIISPYTGESCEILHRHSVRDPFHHQQGKYETLFDAIIYIKQHDDWFNASHHAASKVTDR